MGITKKYRALTAVTIKPQFYCFQQHADHAMPSPLAPPRVTTQSEQVISSYSRHWARITLKTR